MNLMYGNSGQSCNAPSRMLVPTDLMGRAAKVAAAAAKDIVVGDPNAESARIGPVVSDVQFARIQSLLEKGLAEGATLEAGGPGRPERSGQRILRPADRVLARHERHDHRP